MLHFVYSTNPNNLNPMGHTISRKWYTVYTKKYAHGFCFAVLCCGYTLTDFPISIRLSNDCPSASKATLMNMDKYFMWIHYERLHNHNKAKHNKTVCIFLGIYCMCNVLTASIWCMLRHNHWGCTMSRLTIWCHIVWRCPSQSYLPINARPTYDRWRALRLR